MAQIKFPNEIFDSDALKMIEDNFSSAVTGESGLNSFRTNPLQLHRIQIPKPKIESLALLEFELRLIKSKFQNEQE